MIYQNILALLNLLELIAFGWKPMLPVAILSHRLLAFLYFLYIQKSNYSNLLIGLVVSFTLGVNGILILEFESKSDKINVDNEFSATLISACSTLFRLGMFMILLFASDITLTRTFWLLTASAGIVAVWLVIELAYIYLKPCDLKDDEAEPLLKVI